MDAGNILLVIAACCGIIGVVAGAGIFVRALLPEGRFPAGVRTLWGLFILLNLAALWLGSPSMRVDLGACLAALGILGAASLLLRAFLRRTQVPAAAGQGSLWMLVVISGLAGVLLLATNA